MSNLAWIAALTPLIVELLRIVMPYLFTHREILKDADPQPATRAVLKKKILRSGWSDVLQGEKLLLGLLFCALLFGSGCSMFRTDVVTVMIPEGTPVRLAKDVKKADVWVLVEGQQTKTRMTLPAGSFVMQLTADEMEEIRNAK